MSALTNQVDTLTSRIGAALPGNLVGVYAHGSYATDSFDATRSDLDLLVVTWRAISAGQRAALLAALLGLSGRPAPVEITFMTVDQVRSWQHPAEFELHFGESQRADLEAGRPHAEARVDPDLAVHIAVLRQRGRRLRGAAIAEVFPWIPEADLLDGLRRDFEWALPQAQVLGHYLLTNAARTLAYLTDRRLRSKAEALAEAERWLPARFRPLARAAQERRVLPERELQALAELVIRRLLATA